MEGQWVGEYNSQNPGRIILNVDALPTCYQAVAYVHPNTAASPKMVVRFRTIDKSSAVHQLRTTDLSTLHPDTGTIVPWDSIKDRYASDVQMSKAVDIVCTPDGDKLSIRWGTDIGLIGQCELPRSKAGSPSDLKPKVMTWQEYRSYIETIRGRKLLFRGQSRPWRLRTSFHRHGRADLERFVLEDVRQLHKYLVANTKRMFNLSDGVEFGAVLALAQHHGYPTPLLDWTASPFVGAFFAYRGADPKVSENNKFVRILTFDQDKWMGMQQLPQSIPLLLPDRNVSLVEFLAIENQRMIPQQGVSMQSNVDDIEGYMKALETHFRVSVLEAIDLPIVDRDFAIDELRYMGITAGSMFPGLDGVCEDLKERNFRP
ncbi:FRG domain-containing protein [Rhodospirillales bacterium URHD0017]|nr:FRG domain-containing protein [Rhodospirillales bacterium URHD0017]